MLVMNKAAIKELFEKLSGFQTRQRALLIFVVLAVAFLLFYWTGMAVNNQKVKAESYTADTQMRLADVQRFMVIQQSGRQDVRKLDAGLLSHIQGIKGRYGLNGDIVNIRLVSSGTANQQEQVSFRAENLVYQEFTAILNDLEQYDNIWVKTVNVSKRFDNTERIDVAFDVIRGEP
ncbi:MAG: hypothetical protein LBV04_10210 [Deferribacteraceae bacterium]|jgi:hypothetical protein|nr:hypothetical protein [Deferribacteraceae bacterium]